MAQFDIAMRARAAQIEIAVAQACFFAGVTSSSTWNGGVFELFRMCRRGGHYFHFARGNFWIRFLPANHLSFDGDDEFRAQLFGLFVRFGMQLFIEDDLRDSSAVAQINEDQLAEIAAAMHPTHEDDIVIGVGCAQVTGIICALQVSERVEQVRVPFRLYGLTAGIRRR